MNETDETKAHADFLKEMGRKEKAEDILGCTLYGEARGEYALLNGGMASLIAVGNVVMNRLSLESWFGQTVQEVCLKPLQFSCWNWDDPNFALLKKGASRQLLEIPLFQRCLFISHHLVQGAPAWPDLTQGATHYYSLKSYGGGKRAPSWAFSLSPTFRIGNHIFFR